MTGKIDPRKAGLTICMFRKEANPMMERKQTTIRLPVELHKELVAISKQSGLTVMALLILAIWWNVLRPKHLPQ